MKVIRNSYIGNYYKVKDSASVHPMARSKIIRVEEITASDIIYSYEEQKHAYRYMQNPDFFFRNTEPYDINKK